MGRPYELPSPLMSALVEMLGETAREVVVIEYSRYARLHGAAATTRPNRIYVAGPGDAFATDLPLVLHEYCHVVHQWATGRLTRTAYVVECLRRGYHRNRFEIEAREFAATAAPRFAALVALRREQLVAGILAEGSTGRG
ncbi:MAG: hypothetical protein U1F14_09550 [Steroidobacteraceae bacterium]|jgi:hypothetical protein